MYSLDDNTHILHLIGHAFVDGNPLLVLEYCDCGDLLSYLRTLLQDYRSVVRSVSALN